MDWPTALVALDFMVLSLLGGLGGSILTFFVYFSRREV